MEALKGLAMNGSLHPRQDGEQPRLCATSEPFQSRFRFIGGTYVDYEGYGDVCFVGPHGGGWVGTVADEVPREVVVVWGEFEWFGVGHDERCGAGFGVWGFGCEW